ncbi:hypothetical protein ACFP63_11110 [Oerskovia jenensis]|uniref:Transcriptional regulator with XRE-family HTH domain n=1 Tax=Oerskovia jenensis TaxID=162169 RepID=A0ABS2LKI3_9CELL|nr:helix-turn-helix transcriptional regulator [Oerskovia jenensis]MBM7480905.1 transcriptional regulator with XRE-family HTH domain [Oerskovia jenensis]
MDINEATARAIAAERAISGMTVRELAARAGIPERSLMRVLQAEREIKVVQVAQLAEAFEIYPHEIIERAEVILARAEKERPAPGASVHAFPARTEARGTTVTEPGVIAAMEDYDGEDLVAEMESHEEQP